MNVDFHFILFTVRFIEWCLGGKKAGGICISDLVFGELYGVFPLMLRGCEYGGVVLNMDMVGA